MACFHCELLAELTMRSFSARATARVRHADQLLLLLCNDCMDMLRERIDIPPEFEHLERRTRRHWAGDKRNVTLYRPGLATITQ